MFMMSPTAYPPVGGLGTMEVELLTTARPATRVNVKGLASMALKTVGVAASARLTLRV